MPALDEHLRMAGMLTGAAAHELNNILGILSLRLEKLEEDRQARAPEPGEADFAAAQSKDLSVMERNLSRAAHLVSGLQGFLRSRDDVALLHTAEAFAAHLEQALGLQQSIYERKIILRPPERIPEVATVVSVRPCARALFQALVTAVFQRVVCTLGYGTELKLSWNAGAAGLELRWNASAAGPVQGAAPEGDPMLATLVQQSEELSLALCAHPLEWTQSEVEDPESALPLRQLRVVVRFAAA